MGHLEELFRCLAKFIDLNFQSSLFNGICDLRQRYIPLIGQGMKDYRFKGETCG